MTSLMPTLELTAGTYSTRDRPLPTGSGAENPRGWKDYWTESLADSGIFGLAPLAVGHSLVALSDLTDAVVLRTILRKTLEDVADWNLDELGPLEGGYVLQHQDAVIAPGCCGDLSSLRDWAQAAAHTSEAWAMVWIGHPWTHVRACGDTLHLAAPSELSPSEDPAEALSLQRQQLLDAIESARRERHAFGERLLPLIEELAPRVSAQSVLDVLLLGHPLLEAVA
jgi:hypothetical protein